MCSESLQIFSLRNFNGKPYAWYSLGRSPQGLLDNYSMTTRLNCRTLYNTASSCMYAKMLPRFWNFFGPSATTMNKESVYLKLLNQHSQGCLCKILIDLVKMFSILPFWYFRCKSPIQAPHCFRFNTVIYGWTWFWTRIFAHTHTFFICF